MVEEIEDKNYEYYAEEMEEVDKIVDKELDMLRYRFRIKKPQPFLSGFADTYTVKQIRPATKTPEKGA